MYFIIHSHSCQLLMTSTETQHEWVFHVWVALIPYHIVPKRTISYVIMAYVTRRALCTIYHTSYVTKWCVISYVMCKTSPCDTHTHTHTHARAHTHAPYFIQQHRSCVIQHMISYAICHVSYNRSQITSYQGNITCHEILNPPKT